MDVTDWLRNLGLERYAGAFQENEVTLDLLPKLTAQDLQDLGVTAVGHRRRLLDAIAALQPKTEPARDQPVSAAPAADLADGTRAFEMATERRHITVMFCDLVGSTSLSTRLDPEDLRELLDAYRISVVAAVTDKRGYVSRFLGDGVLAYFGWPNPDEAHADSAVRAALAALEAVHPRQLSVRIGIATGLVVVGDLIWAGTAREFTAVGETPNLAARLQGLAEPDRVVVSDATRSQLGQMFELEELAATALKGFESPVRAWRVVGPARASSRSEAVYASPLPSLIGRDEELDLLLRRWRQAKAGEGRVVLISGEAGIGKSRLLAALEEQLADEPHTSLRYFCSPHQQNSPLYPIIARLEQEAGFSRADTAADRLTKLERVLARTTTPPDDTALIAALLSIDTEGRYLAQEFSPQRRKERTLAALIRRLAAFARSGPVLILLEDAHWADPTSLELLDGLVEHILDLPVLVLVAFRPDFSARWFGRAGVSLMALSRLERQDATALVKQVVSDNALAMSLLDRIVLQADGVPLFIEELTKAVLEATDSDRTHKGLVVPDTLQASLMARLDRMPVAKQVAQIGAVIGREFSHAVLLAVARMPGPQLAQGIDEMIASGLVFARGAPPDAVYVFKHALIQDVAYESLLHSRRADVHARVVEVLEKEEEDNESKPALLGHHCTQAGLITRAAAYYRMAGERLQKRAAFTETRALLERGLMLLANVRNSDNQRRLEVELLFALSRILQMTNGSTDTEADTIIERVIHLSRSLDDKELLSRALGRRLLNLLLRSELQAAWRDALELKDMAVQVAHNSARIPAHATAGFILFLRGNFIEARGEIDIVAYLASLEPEMRFDLPFDITVAESTSLFAAISLACLGKLDQASAEVSGLSERVGRLDPFGQAMVLGNLCRFALVIPHDIDTFQIYNESLTLIAQEQIFSDYILAARRNQAFLDIRAGRIEQGLLEWNDVKAAWLATNYRLWGSYGSYMVADALAGVGQANDALAHLTEGLRMSAQSGEAWLDAELYRRRGELLLVLPEADPHQAEQQLRTAIDIARSQAARLFELRAAISLARLWSAQNRQAEARDLLRPVYNWFTEGRTSLDLQQARDVLTALG